MSNKYSLPEDGGAIEKTALQDIIHRYEKISTQVFPAETDGVRYVADRIVRAIAAEAGFVPWAEAGIRTTFRYPWPRLWW